MVLNLVDELRGVLQPDAYGNTLCLNLHAVGIQPAIDVARRVACGKHDGRGAEHARLPVRLALDALDAVSRYQQRGHLRLEVHLSATAQNGVAHVLNHTRQLVGADVGVCVGEYRHGGSVLAEDVENLLHVAALLAARVELAVAVGTCSALAKAVVRFGVDGMLAADAGDVLLAAVHVLAPLHDDGAEAQLDEAQRSKQPARACTYDQDCRTPLHVGIVGVEVFVVGRQLVDERPDAEVDVHLPLTGVDAALQHPHGVDGTDVKPVGVGDVVLHSLLVVGLLRQHTELVF